MNANEFPIAGHGIAITSKIDAMRAKEIVVRNSRFLIAVTMIGGVVAAGMAVCLLLVALSQTFPISALTFRKGFSALQWALGALAMGSMGPWLWQIGRAMAFYRVALDRRGADFHMGTKKAPQELFMTWDQVASVKRTRAANNRIFTVTGTDGSEATFTSYTFFRPKKLARMIAERAGLTILKG